MQTRVRLNELRRDHLILCSPLCIYIYIYVYVYIYIYIYICIHIYICIYVYIYIYIYIYMCTCTYICTYIHSVYTPRLVCVHRALLVAPVQHMLPPCFLFSFTLVTGPRTSLSIKLSDIRVYEPQVRARLVTKTRFCEVLPCCLAVYIYIYIIYIYIYIYIYICMYVYLCIYIHVYIFICTNIYEVCAYIHTFSAPHSGLSRRFRPAIWLTGRSII